MNDLTPARLRELKREATIRPFDLAEQLGLPEAALVEEVRQMPRHLDYVHQLVKTASQEVPA